MIRSYAVRTRNRTPLTTPNREGIMIRGIAEWLVLIAVLVAVAICVGCETSPVGPPDLPDGVSLATRWMDGQMCCDLSTGACTYYYD